MFLSFNFDKRKPVAIYGAGQTGRALLNFLTESLEYKPVVFLDDDIKLSNNKIKGLKVLKFDNSIKFLKKFGVNFQKEWVEIMYTGYLQFHQTVFKHVI